MGNNSDILRFSVVVFETNMLKVMLDSSKEAPIFSVVGLICYQFSVNIRCL